MKRKAIGKAQLLRLNIEKEEENIKVLEDNLILLRNALKEQEELDNHKKERAKENNRARRECKKIINKYPEFGIDVVRNKVGWNYEIFVGERLMKLTDEKNHNFSLSHHADDWCGVLDRLHEIVGWCNEHYER